MISTFRKITLFALFLLTIFACCGNNGDSDKMTGRISFHPPLVIAHRGFHYDKTTPENSLSAFQEALTLDIWGIECDVRQTKDGVFVINHNEYCNNRIISGSYYSDFSGAQLSNGESLPRLESFLATLKTSNSRAKLLLDIKSCDLDQLLSLIEEYDLMTRILFISFNRSYCDQLVKKGLGEQTYYLSGDMSPIELKEAGYAGINYEESVYKIHNTWIDDAKSMGMKAIVWTINNKKKINRYIQQGVIVTTDKPMYAEGVQKLYGQ